MIRRFLAGVIVLALTLTGLSMAQEPGGDDAPVRLKKKARPEAEDKPKEDPAKPPVDLNKKPEDPKPPEKEDGKEELKGRPDAPADNPEPQNDEGEVLNRVGKNMRTSEDRLANRELTDSTEQVQKDILKDLDDLINREQNGGGGGGGGGQDQNQNQDQQNQPNGGGGQQKPQAGQGQGQGQGQRQRLAGRRGGSRGQGQQMAQGQGRNGQGQPQGPQQANRNDPNNGGGKEPAPMGGNRAGQGQDDPNNNVAEMVKGEWGQLSEKLRAEMSTYKRDEVMKKYEELIRQYYTTLAEKSRKRD